MDPDFKGAFAGCLVPGLPPCSGAKSDVSSELRAYLGLTAELKAAAVPAGYKKLPFCKATKGCLQNNIVSEGVRGGL